MVALSNTNNEVLVAEMIDLNFFENVPFPIFSLYSQQHSERGSLLGDIDKGQVRGFDNPPSYLLTNCHQCVVF